MDARKSKPECVPTDSWRCSPRQCHKASPTLPCTCLGFSIFFHASNESPWTHSKATPRGLQIRSSGDAAETAHERYKTSKIIHKFRDRIPRETQARVYQTDSSHCCVPHASWLALCLSSGSVTKASSIHAPASPTTWDELSEPKTSPLTATASYDQHARNRPDSTTKTSHAPMHQKSTTLRRYGTYSRQPSRACFRTPTISEKD